MNRWGQPVGVEEARTKCWGELVAAAEEGTVTLITLDRSGPYWVALVPLSKVVEPLEKLPVSPLSEARAKLGDLIRAATNYYEPEPQLLSRHRRPVVALIAVQVLDQRPEAGGRLSVEAVLTEGGTVTLEFFPGEPGTVDQHGDVTDPSVLPS